KVLSGLGTLAQTAAGDVAYGVNGTVNLTLSVGSFGVSLPTAEGTVIYDGHAQAVYGHYTVFNALSGISVIKDTPLKDMANSNATVDFTLSPAYQRLSFTGQMSGLVSDVGWSMTLDSLGGCGADFTIDLGSYARTIRNIDVSIQGT